MYRATTPRLISLFLLILIVSGCERRQHLVEQQLLEFGTIIKITMITNDLTRAEQLLTEIERRLRFQRNQWHAWEDSDLPRFNLALKQGSATEVPTSLARLLQLSRHYHDATGGLFNPALGKLVAAHGFHGSKPDREMIAEIKLDIPGMQDLRIESNSAVSNNPHLQIDLGGIAKGYAVGTFCILDTRARALQTTDMGLLGDLASMVESEFVVQNIATVDDLTGLSNRRMRVQLPSTSVLEESSVLRIRG